MALLNPSIALVLASTFLALWFYRPRNLLLAFSGGYACTAAGFLLQYFTPQSSFLAGRLVSAASFTLGVAVIAGAVVSLHGRRPPLRGLLLFSLAGMAAFCWFFLVRPDLVWRIYSLNFAFGGICLLVAGELRAIRHKTPTARILLALTLVEGMNFIVRTIVSIRLGGPPTGETAFGHSTYWMTALLTHALLGLLLALALMAAVALEMLTGLRTDALTDPLSRILNRRGFEEQAAKALARAARSDMPVALVLADLDHFKTINDLYGHAAGDRVIADFAARLRTAAGDNGIAGRIGGEEFAVLLPLADLAAARLFAEAVRTAFSSGAVDGLPAHARATATFGVAARSGSEDLAGLMRRADEALYRAKQNGRDSVRLSYQRPQTVFVNAARPA